MIFRPFEPSPEAEFTDGLMTTLDIWKDTLDELYVLFNCPVCGKQPIELEPDGDVCECRR